MNAAYLVGTGFEDITATDDGAQIVEDIEHSDWVAYPAWNLDLFQRISCVALSTYRSCYGLIPRHRKSAVGV